MGRSRTGNQFGLQQFPTSLIGPGSLMANMSNMIQQGNHNSKILYTVKPIVSHHSKRRPKVGFQDQLSLYAGQKYCRMLQGEHTAILWTFIKLLFVYKNFVLSIGEWLLRTGFTVGPNKQTF